MKKQKMPGLFDEQQRTEFITQKRASFFKLSEKINWELFRPIIEKALNKEAKGPGGRPRYDAVLMFKVLILQRLYNLSDEQTEFQIYDRNSFRLFLGIKQEDSIPDQNTIWLFREKLTEEGVIVKLFNRFNKFLEGEKLMVNTGSIIDATIVEVPIQRNTREENKEIKAGKIPEKWKENPNKLRHKDTDARWKKKGNVSYYGYQDIIKTTQKYKFIKKYKSTSANVHESQVAEEMIDETDSGHTLYGDSAYNTPDIKESFKRLKIRGRINVKGCRYEQLTEKQRAENRKRSKIRCRIEHVFGFMTQSMKGLFIRCIGIKRADGIIGLINLTYNLSRYIQVAY